MLCNEKRSENFRENSKILRKTISSKTKTHGGNHLLILQSHFPFSIRAWSSYIVILHHAPDQT